MCFTNASFRQDFEEHFSSSTFSPSHSRPPFFGSGLSHVRFLLRTPTPHVLLHLDHGLHSDHPPSTMHSRSLQILISLSDPLHGSPPLRGAGFTQLLQRSVRPKPHVSLHGVHLVHGVQPPSVGQNFTLQTSSSYSSPTHAFPPSDGAGESHFLLRNRTDLNPEYSVTHSSEQLLQLVHALQPPFTGHGSISQFFTCTFSPSQLYWWPWAGDPLGSRQMRDRNWVPLPQVALHALQSPHGDQLTGTGREVEFSMHYTLEKIAFLPIYLRLRNLDEV